MSGRSEAERRLRELRLKRANGGLTPDETREAFRLIEQTGRAEEIDLDDGEGPDDE